MTFDLDPEALVVLQRLGHVVEERARDGLDHRAVPGELDLLLQLQLVGLHDHLFVDGAAHVRGRTRHIGTGVGVIGHSVLVAVADGRRRRRADHGGGAAHRLHAIELRNHEIH